MKKTLWAALLAAGTMVSAAVDAEPLRIGVLPAADAIVIHAAADEKPPCVRAALTGISAI